MSTVQEIIKQKPYLSWYTKDPENLSEEAVLESVLNYGDWEDFKSFKSIKGLEETATLFYKALSKKRNNYRPEVQNYFKLYFDKYAQRDFK